MARFGGNPNVTLPVIISNDTDSDAQTIFTSDLASLNYDPYTYQGRMEPVAVLTATNVVVRDQIWIEIQLMRVDGTEPSQWFPELAVITPNIPGIQQSRLSGQAIRDHFYFATAPGNEILYVAMKKNGIVSQLPVV